MLERLPCTHGQRVARSQLKGINVLVNRQLNETVHRHSPAQACGDAWCKIRQCSAADGNTGHRVQRHRSGARVRLALDDIQLQHRGNFGAEPCIPDAGIDRVGITRAICSTQAITSGDSALDRALQEPAVGIDGAAGITAEDNVGRTSTPLQPGIQRLARAGSGVEECIGIAGGQLDPGDDARCSLFGKPGVAPDV